MKKIILIVSLFLTAGSMMNVDAGNAKDAGNKFPLNEIKRTIAKKISVPPKFKTPDFKSYVLVSFCVDSDGKINVITINSSQPELAKHVKEQLEKLQLKKSFAVDQPCNLRLEFSVLQ